MYKIGLASSHGTRKTGLSYGLAEALKKYGSVRVVGELSTIARERGMPIDQKTTLETQAWILLRHCSAELEGIIYNYKFTICDRTVYDNYSYMKNFQAIK